ncbi:M20 family metallo-hydrolase [Pseudoneobacillus sp. C159]
MDSQISKLVEDLYPSMVEWRRDLHKHAESGWLEFRTASLVAAMLDSWGFEVKVGREVIKSEARMGVPSDKVLKQHFDRALQQGANPNWLPAFEGGFTGVVGILDTKRSGPTIGIRFDMDALDLYESEEGEHFPVVADFVSINKGMMHACGHDAHTSIGLGLAKVLIEMKDQLNGRVKIIFQPAEEGVRGAKSMVEAGVVDDVDIFVASHIGTGVPLGGFISGTKGFLSTSKMDVTYTGVAAHAGGKPEDGKNALLAASTAVLNLHGISRHSEGNSRINVGVLQAGSGRNIIPAIAQLKIETRGETSEVNEYILKNAIQIIKGAAVMYDVDVSYEIVGEARSCDSSEELMAYIGRVAENVPEIEFIQNDMPFAAGSEDATYMMERVRRNGGVASYAIFGTTLEAGHHHERFDIDESVMKIAVKTLAMVIANSDHLEK